MSARDINSTSQEVARLRQVNAALAAYREMSEQLFATTTLEEVGRAAVSVMTEVFGAEGGGMLLCCDDELASDERQEYGSAGAGWRKLAQAARWGILEAVLREGGALVEPDAAGFFAREGLPGGATLLANFLAMPLRDETGYIGAVVACDLATPEYLSRYAADAEALLSPVSHAVAHVRLLEGRGRHARLLATILENTNSHVAYLDRDFNFVEVNSVYVAGCGHTREELIGRNHFELFPNAENQAIFERVRDTGEAVEYREKPFTFADQPERGVTYWDWRLTPIKNEQGRVEGLVLSLTDLTDQVRTRERMVEAERARALLAETLVAEVNHRMKNNLTMVAGLLELQISGQPPNAPAVTAVRQAISRVLSLSAVHQQMYETRAESVEVWDILRRIAEISREALARADVEIAVEGESLFYPAKAASMLCVMANELITNAIKHGAPGADRKLRITVAIGVENGNLKLSVWNSGKPVPADFDPREQKGMGLRLVSELAWRQYRGSFTFRPHQGGPSTSSGPPKGARGPSRATPRGGSIAEIVIEDETLRRE